MGNLKDYALSLFFGLISILWLVLRFVFSVALIGVPLVLIAEWCFPDYVHIINKEITFKTIEKLADDNKFNELIWLADKKEPSISKFPLDKQYATWFYLSEANMAVGNYKEAERCMGQMDTLLQLMGDAGKEMDFTNDIQKARLYAKMNNHPKVVEITESYWRKPEEKMTKMMNALGSSKDKPEKTQMLAQTIMDQAQLIYLNSLLYVDFDKNRDLVRSEIFQNRHNLLKSTTLTMNYAIAAMSLDSIKDVEDCYSVLKPLMIEHMADMDKMLPMFLSEMLRLGVYMDDLEPWQDIAESLPKIAQKHYTKGEIEYYKILSATIPYLAKEGKHKAIIEIFKEQQKILSQMLGDNFILYGQEQRENLYNLYNPFYEELFQYIAAFPSEDAAEIGYDGGLFIKQLLLRSQEQLVHAALASNDPQALKDLKELIELKKELKSVEILGGLKNKYASSRLKDRITTLENNLAEGLSDFRMVNNSPPSYSEVKKALKANEAAIEFIAAPDGSVMALLAKRSFSKPKIALLPKEDYILPMLENMSIYESTLKSQLRCHRSKPMISDHWQPQC